MIGLIQKLFGKRDEKPIEIPLEELTTTIAYPDGSKRSTYQADNSGRLGPTVKALLSDLRKRHPNVAERISLTWGDPGCEKYLASLLFDDRAMDKDHQYTARAGFSPEVMSLIMQLQDEHNTHFGMVEEVAKPVFVRPPVGRRES